MRSDLPPLLNTLPPRTARAFEKAIQNCSAVMGLGPDWIRRRIAFTVVAEALTQPDPSGKVAFEIKGGAAIELRLRAIDAEAHPARSPRPRATKDLDASFRGTLDEMETSVRAALSVPHSHFEFRVEPETPDARHMRRFRVHAGYRQSGIGGMVTQPFSNVQLEVAPYEGERLEPEQVPAFSLAPFGLPGPASLPCLPLTKQVAQKLHAVTEPAAPDGTNDRFRDLLDLVLLKSLVPASASLYRACRETFAIRATHPWPPAIAAPEAWRAPMQARAVEMGLPITGADEIVAQVASYVVAIDSALL